MSKPTSGLSPSGSGAEELSLEPLHPLPSGFHPERRSAHLSMGFQPCRPVSPTPSPYRPSVPGSRENLSPDPSGSSADEALLQSLISLNAFPQRRHQLFTAFLSIGSQGNLLTISAVSKSSSGMYSTWKSILIERLRSRFFLSPVRVIWGMSNIHQPS